MNCIIIDGESTSKIIVCMLCSNVVEEFPNVLQSIKKCLYENKVDFIFLDFHTPKFIAFNFIQSLKNPKKIVVTKPDKDFAMEASEHDCIFAYLVKPMELPQFIKDIGNGENTVEALEEFSSSSNLEELSLSSDEEVISENDLFVNIDRRLIKIEIPSIYIIEAKGDYIQIKTEQKNYTVHSTLKKINDKLPDSSFLKVHRSYIINVEKIVDIEDNSVLIKKDVVPISRTNKSKLLKRLNLL
ncbi:MAG: DNA-binding response regulator [Bacteroidetes bacterium HGW-Bacteroidetes-3]|jgi:DNA-binding LytR/AlgR family response regulator|nr:MAG: DNA-binding response regulator [Bacteroidetes bacterium HGW-Bacteroidetes-3]